MKNIITSVLSMAALVLTISPAFAQEFRWPPFHHRPTPTPTPSVTYEALNCGNFNGIVNAGEAVNDPRNAAAESQCWYLIGPVDGLNLINCIENNDATACAATINTPNGPTYAFCPSTTGFVGVGPAQPCVGSGIELLVPQN